MDFLGSFWHWFLDTCWNVLISSSALCIVASGTGTLNVSLLHEEVSKKMRPPCKRVSSPQMSCCCCSVAKSYLTLCNPMDCSMPGFPVLHHLLEFAQTHVHWVGDAIQPSHPLWPPSPPALNLSQHQSPFWFGFHQWLFEFAPFFLLIQNKKGEGQSELGPKETLSSLIGAPTSIMDFLLLFTPLQNLMKPRALSSSLESRDHSCVGQARAVHCASPLSRPGLGRASGKQNGVYAPPLGPQCTGWPPPIEQGLP